MKTRFLLSHKFKKLGFILAPAGFLMWIFTQLNGLTPLVKRIVPQLGKTIGPDHLASNQFWLTVTIMILSFLSFITGLAFLIFSREKNEDEYSQKIRLESLQFSALSQFIILFFAIISVIITALINNNIRLDIVVFERAPILLILLFWVTYFIRFNWILHFTNQNEK